MATAEEVDERFAHYLCLSFKEIYGDIQKPSYQELLADIPTKVIIEIISDFMARIHINERNSQKQVKILKIWVDRFPQSDIAQLNKAIAEALERANQKVLFFNNISSLFFLEKALSLYCVGEPRDLSPDEELRLFKAYLLITEEWTEHQADAMKGTTVETDQKMVEFYLRFELPQYEFRSSKDFRWPLINAIYFFKFIEQNKELGKYLNDFLAKYNAKDSFEYLLHILNGYSIQSKSGASIITVAADQVAFRAFLNELSIDVSGFEAKEDFLSLREKPVFKMFEESYAFFNFNFLIDKLFQSIQFDFARLLQEKGVVANFGDFKSKYYSKEFSERYLLYNLLDYLVGKRKLVKLNGDEIAKVLQEEGLDYYVRFGRKVFLIEFKDVLLSAKAKWSYDYSLLQEDIFKKLVENERGRPKGVSQLSNSISKLSKDGFVFDKFDATKSRIYPILIVTDSAYNSFGINWQLNNEFKKLMKDIKGVGQINDLIVIHIDTLIRYQDELHDRKVICADSFDSYNSFTNKAVNPFDKFISYSQYIHGYLQHKGISLKNTPRILTNEFKSKLPK